MALNMSALLTVADMVAAQARLQPDQVGARDSRRALSFREWDQRSSRLANALLGLGLAKGDRVTAAQGKGMLRLLGVVHIAVTFDDADARSGAGVGSVELRIPTAPKAARRAVAAATNSSIITPSLVERTEIASVV